MTGSLAGARVALLGEFSSGDAKQRCRDHAVAEGGALTGVDDPMLTHVIRGDVSRRLADRLGATPREREFVRRGVIVFEESAWSVADSPTFVREEGEATDPIALRAAFRNPAATTAMRHAAAMSLVAHGSPESLAALHEAICDLAIDRTIEARAFGQLVVRGVSRFERSAPFAVEFPRLRTRGGDACMDAARRLGSVDSYCNDAGRRWCRVRLALPSVSVDDARALAGCLDFVDRVSRRRGARVWIAGFAIPARLGRDAWAALLGTVARR